MSTLPQQPPEQDMKYFEGDPFLVRLAALWIVKWRPANLYALAALILAVASLFR